MFLAVPTYAQQEVVSNIDQSLDFSLDVAGSAYAQSFTTGPATGPTLVSVTIAAQSDSGGTSRMNLRTNSAGDPGTLISTLGIVSIPAGVSNPTFTPASTVDLQPDTTYWLTMGEDGFGSGSFNWTGTASTNQTSCLAWGIGDQVLTEFLGISWIPVFLGYPNESCRLSVQVVNAGSCVPPICANLGDVNMDGVANLLDVGPFIDLLSTGTYQIEADTNGDGVVNLLDIDLFIFILGGGLDDTQYGTPLAIGVDPQGFVNEVLVQIKNNWLCKNSDYEFFLDIEITGLNGGPSFHGTQIVSVHDTHTFASDVLIAAVVVDWTADTVPLHINETYTVCVQVVRHDIQQDIYENIGKLKCDAFGPF